MGGWGAPEQWPEENEQFGPVQNARTKCHFRLLTLDLRVYTFNHDTSPPQPGIFPPTKTPPLGI